MNMEFYERVKELVKSRKLTLRSFIEGLGMNYDSYNSLKRYGNLPRADEAYKIASALGVSVDYLVSGSDTDAYKAKYDSLVKDIKDLAEKIG